MADEIRKTDGTLIRSDRRGAFGYDLYALDDKSDEIFVDGLSETGLAPFTTRLVFHVVDRSFEEGSVTVEQRRVRLRLVIPTPTLLEMCQLLIQSIVSNSGPVINQLKDFESKLEELDQALPK